MNTNEESSVDYYDKIAEEYDSMYEDEISSLEDEFMVSYLLPIFDQYRREDGEHCNVLDVGCGTGWVIDRFEDIPPSNYIGVDPSGGMVKVADRKHKLHMFSVDDPNVEQMEWSDVCLLLFGVGSHVYLKKFLDEWFMKNPRKENQTLVMMFLSGLRPSRCGLHLNKHKLDNIFAEVMRYDSVARIDVQGLTDKDLKGVDTDLVNAYSWIVRVDKCQK